MPAVLAEKLNAQPKPFLKWVGGKRQLLPELLERVPRGFDTYFEPFLGVTALLRLASKVERICSMLLYLPSMSEHASRIQISSFDVFFRV